VVHSRDEESYGSEPQTKANDVTAVIIVTNVTAVTVVKTPLTQNS